MYESISRSYYRFDYNEISVLTKEQQQKKQTKKKSKIRFPYISQNDCVAVHFGQ